MTTETTAVVLTIEEIEAAVANRVELKARTEALATQLAQLDSQLIESMQTRGVKTVTNAKGQTLTVAQGSRTTTDQEVLQANISQRLWAKLTRRVLDPTLYKQAKGLGLIKPEVVELVETTKETAAYLVQS